MAYYYVKSGLGTRTTGSITKQTGAFGSTGLEAADVYSTVQAAMTGGAGAGDHILCSSSHAQTGTGDIIWGYNGNSATTPLYVISVDDTSADTYLAGASATNTGTGGTFKFNGFLYVKGFTIDLLDDITATGSNDHVIYEDCTLDIGNNATADRININQAGCSVELINTNIEGASYILLANGTNFSWRGGTYSQTSSLFYAIGALGGRATVVGVDLSAMGASAYIIENYGQTGLDDDGFQLEVHGCKLSATMAGFVDEDSANPNVADRYLITNSATTSAEAEYQYYFEGQGGSNVESDDAVYRDGSTAFPSGTQASLKCTMNTEVSKAHPFWFDFPTRYATLSDTATDTLRIYLTSSATLYASDVWAEVIYPDGTNKHHYNFLSTRAGGIHDADVTELSTNTESWTSPPSTPKYYHIDMDTFTNDPGADGYPIIRVYVAKASTTIYFDSEVVIA